MPLNRRVTVQQAGINALRVWLEAQPELRNIPIREKWPTPGQPLPAGGSITILKAGRPEDFRNERLMSSTPVPDSALTDTVWSVKARRQNLQIDLWATDDVTRDHLEAVWDELSHKGQKYTLGDPLGDIVSDGLLFALREEDGHSGFASFTFDSAEENDTPDAVNQRDYRSTVQGYVDVSLRITARTSRIARAKLNQILDGGGFPELVVTEAD